MKKNHTNQNQIRGAAFAALALGVLAMLPGCASQDENPTGTGTAQLSLNVAGITDASPDTSTTRAMLAPETVTQVQDDGTVLSFTLTPDARSTTRATSVMTPNNTYKFVVLDHASGKIVGAVDAKAGTASPTIGVPDNGLVYDVVAFSYNNTSTSLPSPGSVNSVPTTIGMSANVDLLYFTEQLAGGTLSPSPATNTRNITFSHKYSQVKVVVNAPGAVTAASFTLGDSYATGLTLPTGAVAKTGSAGTVPISFPSASLGGTTATSDSVAFFSDPSATSLKLNVGTLNITGLGNYSAGTVTFNHTGLQPGISYTLTVNAHQALPAGITLAQNQMYFVPSVKDADYLNASGTATVPGNTSTATTATNVPADGSAFAAETPIDIQGSITTTGVNVRIPVTSGAVGTTIPAYSTTATVPASLQEGGSGPVTVAFSWASQAVANDALGNHIIATIKAVSTNLNAKKLDFNAGIGIDHLGVLMAALTYPYDASHTTTYQLRDIAAIPDKMFGQTDKSTLAYSEHNFLYLPVRGDDSSIWLNNNLGADYANTNNASFNPEQQAAAFDDYHAYGSLFQWGRADDGHELVDWTDSYNGAGRYGSTPGPVSAPTSAAFIVSSLPYSYNWLTPQDNNLWATEASTNNPCPSGFRMPTDDGTTTGDFGKLISAASITNRVTAANSKLKFTGMGWRYCDTGALDPDAIGFLGYYWSSSVNGANARFRVFSDGTLMADDFRGNAYSVRCIKN